MEVILAAPGFNNRGYRDSTFHPLSSGSVFYTILFLLRFFPPFPPPSTSSPPSSSSTPLLVCWGGDYNPRGLCSTNTTPLEDGKCIKLDSVVNVG
jgi:hypothetical protein